ncbi:TPT domain-containing protein [Pycnococcus provasolii]
MKAAATGDVVSENTSSQKQTTDQQVQQHQQQQTLGMARGSNLHGAFLLTFNFLITNAIVYVNKRLFRQTGFPPFTLSCIHLCVNVLFLKIANKARVFESAHKAGVPLPLLMFVAMMQASSVILSQLSLKVNSVGVYQLAKLTQGPLVATVEYFWLGKRLSVKRAILLGAMMAFVGLATVGDLETSIVGVTFALSAVAATSLESVIFGYLHKAYHLVTVQVLDITLVFSSVYMFFAAFVFEYGGGALIVKTITMQYTRSTHTPPSPIIGIFDEAQNARMAPSVFALIVQKLHFFSELGVPGYTLLITSACLSFCVNWSSVSINGTFGPVTYAVLALFKTISIIIMGMLVFDNGMTSKSMVGSFMALVCMALYTRVNLQENSKRQTTKQ